jgi:DNA polymerase I-like protein with 3'-5' exonuclease and polymerase domains
MPDSILNKALEFLGQPPSPPVTPAEDPEIQELNPTHSYAQLAPAKEQVEVEEGAKGLLQANRELKETFPNLIFENGRVDGVISWIRSQEGVALDIETHGHVRRKEDHKKEALSFVKGVIRLVQISSHGETFTLDVALLSRESVTKVMEALKGKALYLHNAIFDLPRILRHFGVDLLDEDVRDTIVLSRLLRAGQWELVTTENGGTMAKNKQHNIRDVLMRELGVKILKETDHRWSKPLTEARLRYATDDVVHLQPLYHDLLCKVEEAGMLEAYNLIRKVYLIYMRQQARGVPLDVALYKEMRSKLQEKLAILEAQLQEHVPLHPEEDGKWVWRNFNKPETVDEHGNHTGRNGVLRALALAGIPLPDTKKHTRLAYLKKYENACLLKTLDQYLRHADIESDTRGWLDLYYEDGRLYPNVQFFSQVTGRSAYSGPALQNIAKKLDLPGMEEASFRDCVRAPEGYSLIKADYSAQELRILCHVTGDENLLKAFLDQSKGGKDPHLVVGEKIAGKELVKDTPEGKAFRNAGKRANYGFSYGAGWKRYQKSIYEDTAELIPDRQAMEEKWAFEEAWPTVLEWQRSFGDRASHDPGAWYTTSFLERRRYVSRGKEGRPSYCDRLNGPIQQGGADQLYLALGKLLDDPLPDVHVIITTHDEIVLECPVDLVKRAQEWLLGHMRAAVRETIGDDLATKDCVEVVSGQNWGSK